MPFILEKANTLARIDRYLSRLEEFALFFISVQALPLIEQTPINEARSPTFRSQRITASAEFEASRARNKISHEQRLCQTYMKQFDTLVQMVRQFRFRVPFLIVVIQVISYSATRITERLDQGSKVAEQFGKIGMVVAVIASIISPLSLLTSFYGMNVQEFTSDASIHLPDVWEVAIPILVVIMVCTAITMVWMTTNSVKRG